MAQYQKVYKANGVPLYLGLVTTVLSAFLHLLLMSAILYAAALLAFDAAPPANPVSYFGALAVFAAASLGIGSVLGLSVKNQAKLTMLEQLVFLPSILLSGILFPAGLLPRAFETIGWLFPASWGYRWMTCEGPLLGNGWPLAVMAAAAAVLCGLRLKRLESE